jgi:hypothetical protein
LRKKELFRPFEPETGECDEVVRLGECSLGEVKEGTKVKGSWLNERVLNE